MVGMARSAPLPTQRILSHHRHCEERSDEAIQSLRDPGLLRFARNDGGRYFPALLFAFSAVATRLAGGRPIKRLISLVAASSLSMSTPVLMPMPSSM